MVGQQYFLIHFSCLSQTAALTHIIAHACKANFLFQAAALIHVIEHACKVMLSARLHLLTCFDGQSFAWCCSHVQQLLTHQMAASV